MKKIVAIVEMEIDDDVNNVTDWLLEEIGNNLMPGEKVADYFVTESTPETDKILDQFGWKK